MIQWQPLNGTSMFPHALQKEMDAWLSVIPESISAPTPLLRITCMFEEFEVSPEDLGPRICVESQLEDRQDVPCYPAHPKFEEEV